MAGSRYVMTIDANGSQAVSELGKIEGAVDGIDGAVDDLDTNAQDAAGGFEGMLGSVKEMAGPIGVAAIATGLLAVAEQAAQIAIDAGVTAELLNTSVEEASLLNAAFGDVGLEADAVVGFAITIAEQLETSEDLAGKLGVKFGEAVDPVDGIRLAIDNWDLLSATERIQIFGEEGALAIAQLIEEGTTLDDILSDIDGSRIITDEDLARAKEFKDTTADLKGIWEGIVLDVGGELIPLLTEVGDLLTLFNDITQSLNVGVDDVIAKMKTPLEQLSAGKLLWESWFGGAEQTADEVAGIGDELDALPDTVPVSIVVDTTRANQELERFYQANPYARPGYTVNQTINVGRSASPAEVNAAIRSWQHDNGPAI